MSVNQLKAIVIGTSAGGLHSLKYILEKIPSDFKIPILTVQHVSAKSDDIWIQNIDKMSI
ncbi:MAG TPA: chemotaxis protein CheB [Cytophagaceae bacterium]